MKYFSWTKLWQYLLLIPLIFMTINIAKGETIWWLHNVDLFFHEAGHTFFSFVGEGAQFLGGTLSQLLAPLIFMLYFLLTKKTYSAAILFWWLGESLSDVGVYISDARSQSLPLLGNGQHDWFYLLQRWGLLLKDQAIGSNVWGLGIFIMTISILFAVITIHNTKKSNLV